MKNVQSISHKAVHYTIRQCGASLLEGIAYLAIAAVVVVGAVSLLISAFGGASTNRTIEEITAIRTAVKKLYMAQNGGYGTTKMNADLVKAKILPASVTVKSATDGTLENAWAGSVVIEGATSQFTIEYQSVPQDVCVTVLSASAGWAKVKAGTKEYASFPVTPSQAADACAGATNTVIWTAS